MTIRIVDHSYVQSNTASNGKHCFVTQIITDENVPNNCYDIFFQVEQRTERAVTSGRVSPSNIASITGTSRTRAGLSAQPHVENPSPLPITQQTPLTFSTVLQQSFNYRQKQNEQHPLHQYLHSRKDDESGWLFRQERLSKAIFESREVGKMNKQQVRRRI